MDVRPRTHRGPEPEERAVGVGPDRLGAVHRRRETHRRLLALRLGPAADRRRRLLPRHRRPAARRLPVRRASGRPFRVRRVQVVLQRARHVAGRHPERIPALRGHRLARVQRDRADAGNPEAACSAAFRPGRVPPRTPRSSTGSDPHRDTNGNIDERRGLFDPYEFATSEDTLYLLSAQGRPSTALTASLTAVVAFTAFQRAQSEFTGNNRRLPVPLCCVLDEAANICRWPELATCTRTSARPASRS